MSIDALRYQILEQEFLEMCEQQGIKFYRTYEQHFTLDVAVVARKFFYTNTRPDLKHWVSMRACLNGHAHTPRLISRATRLFYIPRKWVKEHGFQKKRRRVDVN